MFVLLFIARSNSLGAIQNLRISMRVRHEIEVHQCMCFGDVFLLTFFARSGFSNGVVDFAIWIFWMSNCVVIGAFRVLIVAHICARLSIRVCC